jgi:hypothetical protein
MQTFFHVREAGITGASLKVCGEFNRIHHPIGMLYHNYDNS